MIQALGPTWWASERKRSRCVLRCASFNQRGEGEKEGKHPDQESNLDLLLRREP